jgi:SAM-dependent methyltransferase
MMITPVDFDRMYAANADPFRVGDSWYEQRKIAVVLASLTSPTYHRTWDTACGTGHLAAALAPRSGYLLASDAAPTACRLTRERLAEFGAAETTVHTLPAAPPDIAGQPFDLVVLSEVLYYLSPAESAEIPAMLEGATIGLAEIVAVNWRHHPDDAHVSGTSAIEQLDLALREYRWLPAVRHVDEDFLLCSWRRPNGNLR